jgi:hypothetical protein
MTNDNKKKNDELEFCSITEQGDLGLGAEVLGYSDQNVLNEAVQKNTYNTEEKK